MLEQTREVIVEAELLFRVGGLLVVHIELGRALDHRVAPRDEDGLLVARRHDDLVLLVGLDAVEVHAVGTGLVRGGFAGGGLAAASGVPGLRVGAVFVFCTSGARGQGCAAADGDDGEAAGAQSLAAGELVAEVGVGRGVVAVAEAGVAALVLAGQAGTRRGERVGPQ